MIDVAKDLTPKSHSEKSLYEYVWKELQTVNKIAAIKEEEFVIRSIFRGKSKKSIVEELSNKYPDMDFTLGDLEDFLILYKDVLLNEKADVEKAYVRRLIQTKTGLNNQLTDLAIKASQLVDKYDAQEDNTNAVAALRTAADIFMKVAKVEGIAKDTPDVTINMQMDKVVNEITGTDSEFKKALFKIMEEPEKNNDIVVEATIVDG